MKRCKNTAQNSAGMVDEVKNWKQHANQWPRSQRKSHNGQTCFIKHTKTFVLGDGVDSEFHCQECLLQLDAESVISVATSSSKTLL